MSTFEAICRGLPTTGMLPAFYQGRMLRLPQERMM